jgi:hypothetical protein
LLADGSAIHFQKRRGVHGGLVRWQRRFTTERRFAKDYEKRYGRKPPPLVIQESEASIEAARVAQENGDPFYLDPGPLG